jgi:hypothetical protein
MVAQLQQWFTSTTAHCPPIVSVDTLSHRLQECEGVGINRTITSKIFERVNKGWKFIIELSMCRICGYIKCRVLCREMSPEKKKARDLSLHHNS